MVNRVCTLALALLFALPCGAESPIYIDVRSPEEFASGHVEDALLMPHGEIGTMIAESGLDKDTPIVLYCRSGRRAELARQTLEKLGYSDVTNAGGYRDLAAELERGCVAESC